MANSTTALPAAKPHPDFPLTPRGDGRWCKKIKGRIRYITGTADEALEEWLRVKDFWLAGREAPPKGQTFVTVKLLVDSFLTHKEQLRDSGELAPRTFDRYFTTGKMLADAFGRSTAVDSLVADDFQTLRATMAKRWGPVALGNEIQMIRSIFRYGHDAGLLDKPVRFGPGFRKPSAKTLRLERAKSGPKLFTANEIRKVLAEATPNMNAMILLGINGGLGNTDLGELPLSALDLKGGWLNYPRPKTGMPRRIPLWKETVAAIKHVIDRRREPIDEAAKGLLFIGNRGEDYSGGHKGGPISKQFQRTLEKAGFNTRTFYDLRRTFQTIGEGAHDLVAVQSIMGHAPASGDMSAIYRQGVDDNRLRAVVDYVRTWLYAKPAKSKGDAEKLANGKAHPAKAKAVTVGQAKVPVRGQVDAPLLRVIR